MATSSNSCHFGEEELPGWPQRPSAQGGKMLCVLSSFSVKAFRIRTTLRGLPAPRGGRVLPSPQSRPPMIGSKAVGFRALKVKG